MSRTTSSGSGPWRGLLLCMAACVASTVQAQEPELPPVQWPELPAQAASAQGLVPPGWRLEAAIEGRLDEDESADLLLLLRMDDAANVLEHDGTGASPFDSNPRMLLVALADGDGYRRVAVDHGLIPRPHSPSFDDFLPDEPDRGLRIAGNRAFTVALQSWTSAGSWYSTRRSFAFRLQDGCVRLVGFDEHALHRASGEISERSFNFLTGRGWTRSADIADEVEGERQWRRLSDAGIVCLGQVGDGFGFEPPGGE